MKNGNHAKGFNKKSIALVAAVALMLVGVVGGTIAWLTDKTETVTNTFTPSNVGVELKETKSNFKMVPGATIEKDPKVTVTNDVDAYVFVKVEESADPKLTDYITYTVDSGWTKLTDGIYYREVAANEETKTFSVLTGDKVTVNTGVDKAMMTAISGDNAKPTLTFTAYVIQKDNISDVTAAAQELGLVAKPTT